MNPYQLIVNEIREGFLRHPRYRLPMEQEGREDFKVFHHSSGTHKWWPREEFEAAFRDVSGLDGLLRTANTLMANLDIIRGSSDCDQLDWFVSNSPSFQFAYRKATSRPITVGDWERIIEHASIMIPDTDLHHALII